MSTLKAFGVVSYTRYKEGVLDEIQTAVGNWYKSGPDDTSPGFSAPDKDGVNAVVNESELVFSYVYKNTKNNDVHYSYQSEDPPFGFSKPMFGKNLPRPRPRRDPPRRPPKAGTSTADIARSLNRLR